MNLEEFLNKQLKTNITDEDLNRHLGLNAYNEIIKYSDLAGVNSIYDILPKDKSYKVILIEDSPNHGHWCSIYRYGDTIEWFDSYGLKYDGELKFINRCIKKMLGEDKHYLTDLLKKVKDRKVIYNKKKLQKLKNGINTCGRWVILRTIMMKDFFCDLDQFLEFVEDTTKENNITGDEMVALWVR
jgi:hypothetical protein